MIITDKLKINENKKIKNIECDLKHKFLNTLD